EAFSRRNKMLAKIAAVLAALASAVLFMGSMACAQAPTPRTIATGVAPASSQFYVAKEGGLFAKNGLDVTINTGPSGSAMVPFLINNQVHSAYGRHPACAIYHNRARH